MGLLPLECVSRRDEGDALCGKAEHAGVEYVLPSPSSLVPMNPVLPRSLSSEASSREAFIQRIWPRYEARQMVLPTFPPSVQEDEVAGGSGSMRNIDASYSSEEQI